MKKLILCGLILISNICFAEVNLDTDDELTKLGIVDKNYKYVNFNDAANYFRVVSNNIASSLPNKTNQDVENTSIVMTPYYSRYMYRITRNLDNEQIKMLRSYLMTKESIEELCLDAYKFKYLSANDHKLEISYKSIDYKDIANIILDRTVCGNKAS